MLVDDNRQKQQLKNAQNLEKWQTVKFNVNNDTLLMLIGAFVFAVVVFLILFFKLVSNFFHDPINFLTGHGVGEWIGLLIVFGVCIFAIYACGDRLKRFFVGGNVKNVINQKLQNFARNNNLVEWESQKVMNHFTGKEEMKKVIVYSPVIAYRVIDGILEIGFRLDGSKKSNNYTEYKEQLSNLFQRKVTYVDLSQTGFVYYVFGNESRQVKQSELQKHLTRTEIKINDDLIWDIRKQPHALIVGGTGSGKTYFLSYIIISLLRMGGHITILDPKRADMSYLAKFIDTVHYEKNQILKALREFVELMDERYNYMRNHKNYRFGADYYDYGLEPCIMFFDEMAAFMAFLNKKEKEECEGYVKQIVLKGRQAGCLLYIVAQKCLVEDVGGSAVRDNLSFRCGLGFVSESGYKMLFGNEDGKGLELTVKDKGAGFVYLDGVTMKPTQFIAPYMDCDFIEEFERLTSKKGVASLKDEE